MTPLTNLDRLKEDQITLKPFVYIYNMPSKFHKDIIESLNYWLNAPEDKVNHIEEIIRITHATSLIVDDIQDNSRFRYGIPAAHQVYGVGFTINAVTQALGIALEKVAALDHTKAIKIYLEAYADCHRGQGMELYWRDHFLCPSEEEYKDMIKQKTSTMFIVIVQLLQLFSDSTENYLLIATLLGIYHGVRDDYCNLFNRERLKGLSDNSNAVYIDGDSDITDGKFTLPIIHAIQKNEIAEEVINILKLRTNDLKLIQNCTSLLEKHGGAKYTADVLRGLENDIANEISRLGGNPKLTSMLKKLRNWRTHEE